MAAHNVDDTSDIMKKNASVINDKSVENTDVEEKKEPGASQKQDKPLLDIAFILDCTGSMNSYIQSCKDNINQISSTIHKETNNEYNIRFGLVLYRDIPPQDKTFITKRIDFTPIPIQIQLQLNTVKATGGGDAPECLTSALYDCYTNLKWREASIKVIVVITDAPPHGLETNVKDGFPDGDPDTFNKNNQDPELQQEGIVDSKYLNVIDIIKSLRDELNASIYSVACEPSLSCNHDFATDFMQYIAEFTDGTFLPLSSASLLPKVIIGSIKQQINLDNLAFRLDEEIKKIKANYGDISDDKVNELIAEKWKNEGVEKKEISVSDIYKNKKSRENVDLLMNEQEIKSLSDFKAKCKMFPRMQRSDFIDSNHGGNYKQARTRGRGRGRETHGRRFSGGSGRGRGSTRRRGRGRGPSKPMPRSRVSDPRKPPRKDVPQKVVMRGGMSKAHVARIRSYRGRGGGRGVPRLPDI